MQASCHGVQRKQTGVRLLLTAARLSTSKTATATTTSACRHRHQCRHFACSSFKCTGPTDTNTTYGPPRAGSRPTTRWTATAETRDGRGSVTASGLRSISCPERHHRRFSCTEKVREPERKFSKAIQTSLEMADTELIPGDIGSWKRLFSLMEEKHGQDGTWACFGFVRERHQVHLILLPAGSGMRDAIIDAAVQSDSRLETVLELAIRLQPFSREWPELYAKVVHALLKRDEFDRAVKWHLRLSRHFPPGPDVLSGLISAFVFDPRPEMRQTLISIYIFSSERSLYDRLVPLLFESGHERLTRYWRRTMVQVDDKPTSSRAWHFINYMDRFGIMLAPEEEEVIKGTMNPSGANTEHYDYNNNPTDASTDRSTSSLLRGIYHDDFVAKWLASSWLSAEFAINLMHKFGVSVIGTRSLQALALREPDARAVAAQIARLDALGIHVSQHAYCRVLVFFARTGKDGLLQSLLRTDIHPDEFDDPATRRRIMDDAVGARDMARQKLLAAVELALETDESPRRLNMLLRNVLKTRPLGKAKLIVDRMDALNVTMSQHNAATLLNSALLGVSKHPTRWKRHIHRGKDDVALDRAIDIVRRIASHKIGIPIRYWELLLYSLGRHGRFDELLQLCLEVVDIYHPPGGGLAPVYRNDMPPSRFDTKNHSIARHRHDDDDDDGTWRPRHPSQEEAHRQQPQQQQDTHYIPGDLRFTHIHHPIGILFDTGFQRDIVRWGFDDTLAERPVAVRTSPSQLAEHDIACGVRILAALRDRGVPVNQAAVRNTLYTRIILGELPGRRHRSRDMQYVEPKYVKTLVERAWAPPKDKYNSDSKNKDKEKPLLPSLEEMYRELERLRPRVWKRYPVLFRSCYGGEMAEEDEVEVMGAAYEECNME